VTLPIPVPDPSIGVAVVRDGPRTIVAAEPAELVVARGVDALEDLDQLGPGWWAGIATYDLGRAIERVAPRLPDRDRLPDLLLARFDARLVVEGGRGRLVGPSSARDRLERVLDRAGAPSPPVSLGPARSSLDRDAFEAGVRAIVALLEAGECYQVNLTRRLTWDRTADPRALFQALHTASPAPHAALVSLPLVGDGDVAVVSASPERFLAWRRRDVETRPMKGTARDAAGLRVSAKDRAENVMIVDLARNDLGRIARYGSVRVRRLCALERHPGVHHLVSVVDAEPAAGVGPAEIVRAAFPPGSVTGAPKIRAMEIIDELEPVRRGTYCGSIGWIGPHGDLDLSVAIRTFVACGGELSLHVGGAVVADSEPALEWQETMHKAARLLEGAGGELRAPPRALRAPIAA
jgi:para-aminobenzoate synthetase component 1